MPTKTRPLTSDDAAAVRRHLNALAEILEDRDWRSIRGISEEMWRKISKGEHNLGPDDLRGLGDAAKRLEAIGGVRRLELGELYAMSGNLGNACARALRG
jgi:hypothetical protein